MRWVRRLDIHGEFKGLDFRLILIQVNGPKGAECLLVVRAHWKGCWVLRRNSVCKL